MTENAVHPGRVPVANNIISPVKFAHVVLKTAKYDEMVDWYRTVLGAEFLHRDDKICFMTFDDEHHRVAIIGIPNLAGPAEGTVGIAHYAYSYKDLGELVSTYERLKAQSIVPETMVNHGLSTSLYYDDPDGNSVELQVDNFLDVSDLNVWLAEGTYHENPFGHMIDFDRIVERFNNGEAENELKDPRKVEPV